MNFIGFYGVLLEFEKRMGVNMQEINSKLWIMGRIMEGAIRIYNESGTIAEANWTGYIGDWHNITFDKTVILLANKTYNYTIRTGSYPQIHHNASLLTPNGWINCTKFTDANGRVYYDWIPAIKLWRA